MVATQAPVWVQKWGHGAGKTKRGGLRPPRKPKQPLTPSRTLPQQVLRAPVLCQTWGIPFLGRNLGVSMLIWLYITRGTFCSVGPHPQRIETMTISLTKGHRNANTQVSSLDPWVLLCFHYLLLPIPSLSFFSLCIFFVIFLHFYWKESNWLPTSFPLK